ncbi:hypothetical protein BST61_g9393 [Cercospora zeina]
MDLDPRQDRATLVTCPELLPPKRSFLQYCNRTVQLTSQLDHELTRQTSCHFSNKIAALESVQYRFRPPPACQSQNSIPCLDDRVKSSTVNVKVGEVKLTRARVNSHL